ncbi:hypothetical protein BV20DRAFT_969291 [Pilatotrama ljubarskyi]|nr:hypothetical protein BV20DRAFT_969291 [Pilatotrama ljubarskyi]
MAHISTAPGQSFSIPLGPTSPSAASPSSTSSTVLNSPQPYQSSQYRRGSRETGVYPAPSGLASDIEHDNKRSALAESLSRSVTIVFWYRPDTEPLRLHQEIPTFPLFSFSALTEVVEALHLSEKTYLDTYNPRARAWEQQQMSAVRRVESEQRLLYRLRRGLLEGYQDEQCPSLSAEIRLQEEETSTRSGPLLPESSRKRQAETSVSPPASKHHRSFSARSFTSSYTVGSPPSNAGPSSPFSTADEPEPPAVTTDVLPRGSSSLQTNAYTNQISIGLPQAFEDAPASPAPSTFSTEVAPPRPASEDAVEVSQTIEQVQIPIYSPSVPRQSIPPDAPQMPYATSSASVPLPFPPPLLPGGSVPRKWPNDYFVYEVAAGLRMMESIAAGEPALKQDEVFRRAFGQPYVKSTFCRHRSLWRQAGPDVQREFEELGKDPRAYWSELARRVEKREESARGRRRRAGALGRGEAGEAVENQRAQEGMMNVIGMPLPMIIATHHMQVGPRPMGLGLSAVVGTGARGALQPVPGSAAAGMQDEEPVMGSLRPPNEERQMYQGAFLGLTRVCQAYFPSSGHV